MQPKETVARKMTFYAAHGEYGRAWSAASPSPALDPRDSDAQRALIGFNAQVPHRALTPADVADEPGVAPITFKAAQVKKAAARLHDLKAPGTLPQDNRHIKALMRHGALPYVTKWINAVVSDRAHPIVRDLLAGAVRAALTAKVDTVSGDVVGHRPLGITEKWRCLGVGPSLGAASGPGGGGRRAGRFGAVILCLAMPC